MLAGCDTIYVVHLSPNDTRRRLGYYKFLSDEDFADLNALADGYDDELNRRLQLRIDDEALELKRRMPLGLQAEVTGKYALAAITSIARTSRYNIRRRLTEARRRVGRDRIRVVHIHPSSQLGRGVFGTLLFSGRSAEKLLARGYVDAIRCLNPYGI